MASVFIRTIRKIQPRGLYLLGGWPAGAMYACEIAHRLIKQGEAIAVLIILDMRVPSLTPINIVTHGVVDKTGAFKCINRVRDVAEDQSFRERAHLVATCPALSRYEAPVFPANSQPRHVVVWARQSLNRTEDAPIAATPGPDIGKPLDEMTPVDFERYFTLARFMDNCSDQTKVTTGSRCSIPSAPPSAVPPLVSCAYGALLWWCLVTGKGEFPSMT